ncbi:unnamed protein product [Blumeria hordei]|uniref:Partial AB-hydrolase lipase domain-containing protein n=1 Tax=Blumeria hordei TaxID=2867405 RepID=A0A383UQ41_BLUHO|nr:unnamed protein product [Blumeria hordei]
MVQIPVFNRLSFSEYIALIGSFILVILEFVIRILALALPSSIINLFYRASRRLFDRVISARSKKAEAKKLNITTSIRNATEFTDLCRFFGYTAEEHIVQTRDGYLLGVHRLAWKRGEENQNVNYGTGTQRKGVVYMHHGLLMSSEVWVCMTEEERCLPFRLVELGYDVWLGNNRGNKYSKKNIYHSPNETRFWNFSMDEFAFYDIPDTIEYILQTTMATSLSYIGFSQGTAQAFASLAVHPKLNKKINVFIALAPAMSPPGLSNSVVNALVKSSPKVLFLLFGHYSILSSTTVWQSILYPPIYTRLIDLALSNLFGWKVRNISASQKLAAYSHLYSFTSTKSVVHWFQIIRNKTFHMFDDDRSPFMSLGSKNFTKVKKFPTRNIKSPITLVYGGSDSLVDIDVMRKELPSHTSVVEIKHFEHLDFLWAREVETLVFPHVFKALEEHSVATEASECHDCEGRIFNLNDTGTVVSRDSITSEESRRPLTSSDSSTFPFGLDNTPLKSVLKRSGASSRSNIPRPCNSARKRSKVNTDDNNFLEEVAHTLSPKPTLAALVEEDQSKSIPSNDPEGHSTSALGSQFDSNAKNREVISPELDEKVLPPAESSVKKFGSNGNMSGTVAGKMSGSATGSVAGCVVGTVAGSMAGSATGNINGAHTYERFIIKARRDKRGGKFIEHLD